MTTHETVQPEPAPALSDAELFGEGEGQWAAAPVAAQLIYARWLAGEISHPVAMMALGRARSDVKAEEHRVEAQLKAVNGMLLEIFRASGEERHELGNIVLAFAKPGKRPVARPTIVRQALGELRGLVAEAKEGVIIAPPRLEALLITLESGYSETESDGGAVIRPREV